MKNGRMFDVSMVDATTPTVFVQAKDLGLTGTELPGNFSNEALDLIEEVRRYGAEIMGIYKEEDGKRIYSNAVPKVAVVGPATGFATIAGDSIAAESIDIVARTKALGVIHKAYAITGGICTAAAAIIPGTVVNDILPKDAVKRGSVRVGHPSGIMEFDVALEGDSEETYTLTKASVCRTARRIMDGYVYVPSALFE